MYKYLGVITDFNFTCNWSQHITYVKSKLSKSIGIICKARKVLNKGTILKLYSFIYPYLTYCIEVWGNTSLKHIDIIFKLQKRAIRLIRFSSWKAHTAELYTKVKALTFPKLYVYHIQVFMVKFHKKKLPPLFDSLFMRNQDIDSHFTSQATSLHVPIA